MSDEFFSKIETKLDKISDDMTDLKVIAAKHEETLQHHVKRSDALESLYNYLDEQRIAPIEKDLNQMKGIYKLFLGLGVAATITMAILKLLGK